MFGRQLHLFTIFGFSVKIDASWLFLVILITWSLAAGLFPDWAPEAGRAAHIGMGVAGAVVVFVSVVWHELSHSLVARAFGLPMTGITLFLFGGMAEMEEEPPSAPAELMMAVAGPLSSILLGTILFGAHALATATGQSPVVTGVLFYGGVINMALALFNMVPGFPLDGGRVLRALLWQWRNNLRWATRVASRIGAGFGAVLIALGILELLLGGNPLGGLWWILIGLFLRSAAQQGYRQLIVRRMLEGESVRRFMTRSPVTVPPQMPVQELVDTRLYRYHHKMFPVVDPPDAEGDGRVRGCLFVQSIRNLPRERWGEATVAHLLHACTGENSVSPDDDAMAVLERMKTSGNRRFLVLEGDRLAGILTLKDLLDFLALKLEFDEGLPPREAEAEAATS